MVPCLQPQFLFSNATLIACFPFADSLSSDRKQGYLEACRQADVQEGDVCQIYCQCFCGALAAILPLLLLYAFTTLTNQNPINHPALNTVDGRPYEMQELVHLFQNSPDLFILLVAEWFFIGALFATWDGIYITGESPLCCLESALSVGKPAAIFCQPGKVDSLVPGAF